MHQEKASYNCDSCYPCCYLRGGSIYRYLLAHDRTSTLLAPPYMRLEALLEEPLGHGWGVDIPGYGPSLNLSSLQVDPAPELKILQNNLQAHTLKRAEGDRHADMHQFFNPFPDQEACPRQRVCGQIRFTEAGLGRCMEALAGEVGHKYEKHSIYDLIRRRQASRLLFAMKIA